MNRLIFSVALAAVVAASASAQSAVDGYQLSQSDLRGTARFMSMAGAFGALGGDLSTLTQNPAGIGVYRSSEVGATLDIDMQSTHTTPGSPSSGSMDQTKVYCNNFGYVGAVNLNSDVMPYFQWGASYNRAASFDRCYQGSFGKMDGSLTNFIADYTNNYGGSGFGAAEITGAAAYQDTYAPWMSILTYNNFLMNQAGNNGPFLGLYDDGTTHGSGTFSVFEKGYVDEYSINFGGNIMNLVYWGIGFGITDINYTSEAYYTEDLSDARIPATNQQNEVVGVEKGLGWYKLNSWKHIWGAGFNFKAGVIVKPIPELRLGLAVHTPTYYNLTQEAWAGVEYDFESDVYSYGYSSPDSETNNGFNDWFEWKLQSPWRIMASAAGVINGRFIISADYEHRAYSAMKLKDPNGYAFELMNDDVKATFQNSNIIRVGAEYRLSPHFSVRAGYSYESSSATDGARNGDIYVDTFGAAETGVTPSFALDKSTQYYTAGLGYRYKWFSIDAAYVHRHRSSQYYAYSAVNAFDDTYTGAPSATVTDNHNQIVLSVGFKF